MSLLRSLWSPAYYWPIWFGGLVCALFSVREFWALGTGRPQDTFSFWVWRVLKIHSGERISQWTALDFLTFGVYVTVFIWLAFHFFFRRFT